MQYRKKAENFETLGKRLGQVIAKRRKARGLTQDDLAGLVEVDPVTVSRFERGTSVPSLQRLFVIAQALEASVGELLAETSPLPGDSAPRLATLLKGLQTADQQLLMDIADLLQKR